MNNKALAVKIANFMYDYDTYSFWDSFSDRREAVNEVKYGLNNNVYREGMCNMLLDIAEHDEVLSNRIRAAKLYRKVIEYEKENNYGNTHKSF